jgi:hypothetical protein
MIAWLLRELRTLAPAREKTSRPTLFVATVPAGSLAVRSQGLAVALPVDTSF